MNKVLIVGSGVVGQATGKGLARMGVDVTFYDVDSKVLETLSKQGYQTRDSLAPRNYYIVSVPERYVEDVVKAVARFKDSITIIKSTVPVGTTRRLHENYGCNLIHNPEFLREATAEDDFLNAHMLVLGSPRGRRDSVLERAYEDLYWWYPRDRTIFLPSDTSEMVKLALNGYLSTVIGYWNEVDRVCVALGINSHEVGRTCSRDPRVTPYGATRHGKPFGGKCLPKDLDQLVALAKSVGVSDTIFEKVKERNV